jgi:hypothetical protein
MKKQIFIFLTLIIISFACSTNDKGKINYQNSQKVKVGMDLDSLISIMGIPDTITAGNVFLTYPSNFKVYSYQNTTGSSDAIHIVLDTSRANA